MIPLYYRGEKLLTKEAVKRRLRIGDAKVDKLLVELEGGAIVRIYGHRLFMDEEGIQVRQWHRDMAKIRKMLRSVRRAADAGRTSLLAPGYCTHRLGVYNG